MEECPNCGSEVSEGEKEAEFTDEYTESVFVTVLTAQWCDSCGFFSVGAG